MKSIIMSKSVSLMALVALAGCNQMPLPDFTTTGSVFGSTQAPAYSHTLTEKRSVQEAFVELPATAGKVFDVTQTRYGNGVEQLIIYQGDALTSGENVAKVQLVSAEKGFGRKSESLKLASTSLGQIRAEMRKVLPGVSMRISTQLHSNAYGPFGYALGRSSGNVQCLYGWQTMKGTANDRWAIIRGQSAKPSLSIRLRVCRASTSADQLVDLMRDLRVEADPAQALRPTSVSWRSGSGEDLSTAMPQYEPGGYVSDSEMTVSEPVVNAAPVTRKKRVVKKRAKTVRRATTRQPKFVSPSVSKRVYSPPLPAQTLGATPTVNARAPARTNLVPSPAGASTPVIKAPKTVAEVSYVSPIVQPKVVAPVRKEISSGSVPLPN